MRKAGGIIGLIAGIFGVLAAVVTLLFGGMGAAMKADRAGDIVGLGWAGLFLSFLCIVFGALAMSARGRLPGLLLTAVSVLAIFAGGTLVAICMLLALVGGILASIPGRARATPTPVLTP